MKRAVMPRLRHWLVRYARARPAEIDRRRVTFVVMAAYAMDGTVRTTWNLAEHLASAGYRVDLLSVRRDKDDPFFGPPPPGVSIQTLDDCPRWLVPLRWLLSRRMSVFMHPEDRSFTRFDLWTDIRMAQALRRRTGFLVTTRPGLNLIATQMRPPGLVLIGQEHMNLRDHSEILQGMIQRHYKRLALLTVLTQRDRKRYRKLLGPGRPRVVPVPNTVRDMGEARADLSAKTVLAAGRFVRQKGFDRLIQAWELVAPKHPEWRLRILGEGPWQEKLELMIEARGLADSVTLEAPVEDLGAEMADASIFVLSSRWEGLPLVLLEAMSVGMSVISFNCPTGPADVIDDHENGLLIRPRTIATMAGGLDELMSDEGLRSRLATAAINTAAGYSMDAVGPRWEELLHETWERRGPKPA